MMVQTAVAEVVQRATVKFLHGRRSRIKAEIVFLKNFRQVEQVIFRSLFSEILKHVVDRRWRAAVIEGSHIVRQKQEQAAARPRDSFPLIERFDRISEVLQVMR